MLRKRFEGASSTIQSRLENVSELLRKRSEAAPKLPRSCYEIVMKLLRSSYGQPTSVHGPGHACHFYGRSGELKSHPLPFGSARVGFFHCTFFSRASEGNFQQSGCSPRHTEARLGVTQQPVVSGVLSLSVPIVCVDEHLNHRRLQPVEVGQRDLSLSPRHSKTKSHSNT